MPDSRPHRANEAQSRSRRQVSIAPRDFPIVGIGVSAGGLDACRKFLEALPAGAGMAFIIIQHLDPTHQNMMVDLLKRHTAMPVLQALSGMPIERDHVYVIPPGTYLSASNNALQLSQGKTQQGPRLPFDFFLFSLAAEYGSRAVGVVLSGTGADGALGLKAVKENGGLVIAQDPEQAGFAGMPRSAIATGVVDLVLPVTTIPAALVKYNPRMGVESLGKGMDLPSSVSDRLPEIIDLLRAKTTHEFTHYKTGTLRRRIERRMAMMAVGTDIDRYLELLQSDSGELELLVQDLLINVTSFFRDPNVFEFLAEKIIPDLVRDQPPDRPLRIWIAGCSTGEETYSLAMLFREEIVRAKRDIKLQVFASDADPDAIAIAREGLYRDTALKGLSLERLARFFVKEAHSYRVSPELRSTVVFTVQDVLSDPPFSRIDMISCRNLLIYLRPEAQDQVVSLFHFALRENGLLLVGSSETIGNLDGRFELVSKSERLYRRVGHNRPGDFGLSKIVGDSVRVNEPPGQVPALSRQTTLAELCRRWVVETYAPATILINRKHECLYFLGPTDRYLRVAPGHPTLDLLAMARQGMRVKLRAAIHRAMQERKRVVVAGGHTIHEGNPVSFSIVVQPIPDDAEELLLICFIDEPAHKRGRGPSTPAQEDIPQVIALEQELEATRIELQGAIRSLEISNEEQKAINEEALSVNEEYQSTNEELLASKEELQSLNEELTALNSQLHETLDRQRTTANDLQNILYSTDVATLFLDTELRIRFFTPATKSLFNLIPSDIGRPLSDLNPLARDDRGGLLMDARTVLQTSTPLEREIEGRNGGWYIRRISPYRIRDDGIEGVVITYIDITERRHQSDALEAAKRQAEQANIAKSRFLAAASHDLRQPLQTLAMLQGLLAKMVDGKAAPKLIALLNQTLGAMSGMLNTLLDINQIDAGIVHAEAVDFSINDLLVRLREEFTYHAQAKGLDLRLVPCSLSIRSDPRLLEQMIRNLLSNAMKYTEHGKVLLGCRRHKGMLSIEIWDTGIGIPDDQLQAIFEEYHQVDNAMRSRGRGRGLGLGLAIVQRLGNLLGHRIGVRSRPGKGSAFAIEVTLPPTGTVSQPTRDGHNLNDTVVEGVHRNGAILVVEDDPDMRDLFQLFLEDEGHRVATASDGVAALELIEQGRIRPDLVLADYQLPRGLNGLQLAARLREALHRDVPVIILTGDISTDTLRDIARQNCVQLHKPVTSKELTRVIQHLLKLLQSTAHPYQTEAVDRAEPPIVYIVDDDNQIRGAIRTVLEESGRTVEDYATCEAFLAGYRPGRDACLLVDAYMPGMSGLDLLRRLREMGHRLPAIMITGVSDVRMAVEAMKAGASDFIEKPIGTVELLASIQRTLDQVRDAGELSAWREEAAARVGRLTPRQRQIMNLVLAGQPSKNIAADLGISQRTVEYHRASIMKKTGVKSLPALARLALALD